MSLVIVGSKPPGELDNSLDSEQMLLDDLPGLGVLPAASDVKPTRKPRKPKKES